MFLNRDGYAALRQVPPHPSMELVIARLGTVRFGRCGNGIAFTRPGAKVMAFAAGAAKGAIDILG
jgi:hypothetical protein